MKAKVYTRDILTVFDLIEHPVWVFDITMKSMWWANTAALTLWNSDSLDELLHRNFKDMSDKTERRLAEYLVKFQTQPGFKIKDQWTFYPNGQGAKHVITLASGILIDSPEEEEPRIVMLIEGVHKDALEAAAEATLLGMKELKKDIQDEEQRRRAATTSDGDEGLLFDVFPRHIANALRDGKKVEPESREAVTIFFSDIVGFTSIASTLPDIKVSDMLDRLYSRVDELSVKHQIYKVETIGDSWMGVTNMIQDQPDHATKMVEFAVDMIHAANETLIDIDDPTRGCVNVRVGLHSGPVVANVVGTRNPRYCLFGDVVNVASRMESSSQKNRIHCSEKVVELLRDQGCTNVTMHPRGGVRIKGKGKMHTYWITPRPKSSLPSTRLDQPLPSKKHKIVHTNPMGRSPLGKKAKICVG